MTKTRENRIRRALAKQGYLLRKSRKQPPDCFGGYMIIDAGLNAVVCGSCFNLSLDDVEEFLSDVPAGEGD